MIDTPALSISAGQNLLLVRNVISPIGSPVDRNDDKIAWPPERHDLVSDLAEALVSDRSEAN